jgi:hypothetical protein
MDAGSSMRRWNQKGSVDRIVIAILLACSCFLSYSLIRRGNRSVATNRVRKAQVELCG